METAVIDFLFSALAQLAAQYPDAAWLAVAPVSYTHLTLPTNSRV